MTPVRAAARPVEGLKASLPRKHARGRLNWVLRGYLAGAALLVLLPALMSLGLAFFQYDTLGPPRWAGLTSFYLAYSDELFLLAVQNSLALVLLPLPARVLGALLLARLLQKPGRGVGWLRAAVFLPGTIPPAAFALAGLWIFNPLFGPVNHLLGAVGLVGPAWFAEPAWAKPGLALLSLWYLGEGFLVCLAALQDIPADVNDAARVDGAGALATFGRITLPVLAPTLIVLAFRDLVLTFQNSFVLVSLATGGRPYYSTYVLPLFVYEQGFDLLALGTASAALWGLYALAGLLALGLLGVVRLWQIGLTDESFFV
jgi:multiple sugar transport system permease protein